MSESKRRTARCDRCSVPSPDHPDAASNGGISVFEFMDGEVCLVCLDGLLGEKTVEYVREE